MPSTKDYSAEVADRIDYCLGYLIATDSGADFWLKDLKDYLTEVGVDETALSEVYGISQSDLEKLRFESYQRHVNFLFERVLLSDSDLALSGLWELRSFLVMRELALSAFKIDAETIVKLKEQLPNIQPQNLKRWLSIHLHFC